VFGTEFDKAEGIFGHKKNLRGEVGGMKYKCIFLQTYQLWIIKDKKPNFQFFKNQN